MGDKGLPVSGTVAGLAPGDLLWVVTEDLGSGVYRPQPNACSVKDAGVFDCGIVEVGTASDRGHHYDVLVLRATEAAANTFIEYLDGHPGRGGPGLAALPSGTEKVGTMSVVRR